MIKNPWVNLPINTNCHVLNEDLPYIQSYNALRPKPEHRIKTDRMPEPRLGPIDAPIIILQSNPSYDESAPTSDQVKSAHNSLIDEYSPHLCVSKNDKWWNSRYRSMIQQFDPNKIANSICSIEYFPYKSKKFAHSHIRLPSQAYTFELVRYALKRSAMIIITRGYKTWVGAIPELLENKNVIETNNQQCAYITERNLPPNQFKRMLAMIK